MAAGSAGGLTQQEGRARGVRRAVRRGLVLAALVTGTAVGPLHAAPCPGDCGGDGVVSIDEIIVLVTIALGTAPAGACGAGDVNGDGAITVDEIVAAVSAALQGCPAAATPTPTPTATPTPDGSPRPLGRQRFVLDPARSTFEAVIAPGFALPLGGFRGQTGGVVEDAYLDLEAGIPDANGVATIDVTGASEYIFVDGANVGVVLCLKPLVPVQAAGVVDCDGGLDLSIVSSVDHRLGQLGVDGFTADDCQAAGGAIEGRHQVCAAGTVGAICRDDLGCDTRPGTGDGRCGLADGTCTEGRVGQPCRNDAGCDARPGGGDGVCGTRGAHPGVCNGPLRIGQAGSDSGPGAAAFAPLPQFGLNGLPVELIIERSVPCGDEGRSPAQTFALTTGLSRSTIRNFNNSPDTLELERQGINFSCAEWPSSRARFVLSFAALHQFQASDIITSFTFEGRGVPR